MTQKGEIRSIIAYAWGAVAGVLLSLSLGLWSPLAAAADDRPAPTAEELAKNPDLACTRCHDETEQYPVLSIGKTKHGVKADHRTPTCQACHGESPTHIRKPQGVKERPKPDVNFSTPSKVKPDFEKQNKACISCHQGRKLIHWQGSQHSKELACTSCHQMHVAQDRVTDKRAQPEVCFNCHKEQRVLFNRQSHHPVKEGKMACSDCHASHGSAGPKLMARDSVVQTCYTCHMEKRGPFVRTHQPVSEDCAICHNPHGSINDTLLKTRTPFLCQQCHEPSSHQGGYAGLATSAPGAADRWRTNAGLQGITAARSCVNCHTNVHGTNNPVNVNNERTYRR